MVAAAAAEDALGQKLDRCLTDGLIKFGGGILVGGVVSLLFFRRKWPMIMGGGIGVGMAYNSCEISLNEIFSTASLRTDKNDPLTGELILNKKGK
ncbi:MICOS complex subunit Mic10-like [Arctopsyche grandis]|uniref:MICOS complex subunit Mic10-like n=1 Tax=Arctopsyche grandis TaxID=121162 RepID=UPI00406D9324